ncbi:CpaD family pilus assembly lipoprotein [Alsobacter sp. SYSU M60028]|uniref:CpaD family pilus assembly lipoprotein n=1 Tax=Alsobacter ponti TaxID=2962936 RepID=A0ABT1L9L2_9HYPH|nr:CpaD family pilus assembly protein [Alsobacter ponti]MCP8938139.1 CpaD family pilus assembly lipoprotein [Alsobacter ponti]
MPAALHSLAARPLARAAAALSLLLALGACRSEIAQPDLGYPNDYRVRHPIALAYAPTELDLFLGHNGYGLDERQARDLQQFLQDYREHGRGGILVLVPVTGGKGGGGAQSVRASLASAGLAGHQVRYQNYSTPDAALASPVRLSFTKMQAKVLGACGDWRQDLNGEAASVEGWKNKPYPNMGCAYQTALANQVDDPVDFVRPRAETRSDIARRMKAIDDLRKGQDPSTNWKSQAADVSTAVGSN